MSTRRPRRRDRQNPPAIGAARWARPGFSTVRCTRAALALHASTTARGPMPADVRAWFGERRKRPPLHLIMEMPGVNLRSNEPCPGFVLNTAGRHGQLLIHKARALEPHGLDGGPAGDGVLALVLSDGRLNDFATAQFIAPARDTTKGDQGSVAARWGA